MFMKTTATLVSFVRGQSVVAVGTMTTLATCRVKVIVQRASKN